MRLLELLSVETGASVATLKRIIATAPRRYKVYDIPKRSGGTRTIAHPARGLKAIQRAVLHEILDQIEPSAIAMAYVRGRGIAKNAEAHLQQRWILKLDFNDFFHSITPRDWDRTVRRFDGLGWLSREQSNMHRLLFWGAGGYAPKCLSIGAPTSPSVSNLVCIRLDQWLIERADTLGLVVTRYADDITVSGSNRRQLLQFEENLRSLLHRSRTLQLSLNDEKRGLYGPGDRRMVTGLILTPDGKVSIGRERKREIRALIHRFSLGIADQAAIKRAKGLLAFAKAAEEPFFSSMKVKYGKSTIKSLFEINLDEMIDLD